MATIQAALDWLQRFVDSFTPSLNKIVIFFLVLFVGFLIGKILGRLVRKVLADLKADSHARHVFGWKLSVERGMSGLVQGIVYLVSVIIALNAVGLTTVVLEIILTVLLVAILLSFLIAIKDIIPNAASGVTLRQKLRPGMRVTMDDAAGVVKEITILETVIETKGGDTIVIPNALFAKRSVRIKRSAKR